MVAEVTALKRTLRGELQVHGSSDLAQTLLAHDLIDEYRLLVFPVLLGSGRRLFERGVVPSTLTLVSSRPTGTGVVYSVYRRRGALTTGNVVLHDDGTYELVAPAPPGPAPDCVQHRAATTFDPLRGIGNTSPALHPTAFPRRACRHFNEEGPVRRPAMANVLQMQAPPQELDDDAWDDLLSFIEEKRVIPIIGPELLEVETAEGPRLLYEWIAGRLAEKLGVDTEALPKPLTLNDVLCWYLAARGRREEAYARVRSIMRDADFAPPLALRQLAAITDFDLFVTTTFDPLLERAVNEVRFAGAQSVEVVAYSPNRVADIPAERERLTRPVVYHLLGRLSASPTYVVSDEDMLEFICALQSEHLTPEKLFHELEHNHLLFIGSSFTNWLARLFLRMAKRRRLSDPRDVGEVLADSHSGRDTRLMGFLQQVSVRTRVYSGAQKFVDELHRRWTTRRGPGEVIALRYRAAPLPPPRARDARPRGVRELRARRPAGGAAAQGRARRRRHPGVVRPRAARGRRRLRPQDPAQHRALRVLRAGRLGGDRAAAGRLLPARVELRDRSHAQHGRRGGVHPADLHRRHRRVARERPRPVQVGALHAAAGR